MIYTQMHRDSALKNATTANLRVRHPTVMCEQTNKQLDNKDIKLY
jgi:hypothetical protein